jgi:hypothetical protein
MKKPPLGRLRAGGVLREGPISYRRARGVLSARPNGKYRRVRAQALDRVRAAAQVDSEDPTQALPLQHLAMARQTLRSPCRFARRPQDSARQPSVEQMIRAGGSSPLRTAFSTAVRPCVLSAIRVSSATGPNSRVSIAVRDTSTIVEACRPSSASTLTAHEAPTSFEPGSARTDSLTLHATVAS